MTEPRGGPKARPKSDLHKKCTLLESALGKGAVGLELSDQRFHIAMQFARGVFLQAFGAAPSGGLSQDIGRQPSGALWIASFKGGGQLQARFVGAKGAHKGLKGWCLFLNFPNIDHRGHIQTCRFLSNSSRKFRFVFRGRHHLVSPMDDQDHASRWYRGFMGGKSQLQRRLEKELAEKRAANPKPRRKPLKWYWWLAIGVGLIAWISISFWVDSIRPV